MPGPCPFLVKPLLLMLLHCQEFGMWPPWCLCLFGCIKSRALWFFDFFWCGKRDLVARDVLCHPLDSGGFSVVSIKFKVQALLVQWVKRSLVCPNGWVYLLTYRFCDRFDATLFEVFF